MPLLKVRPFVSSSAGIGITIAQSEKKGTVFFRIGLTRAAQERYFGGPIDPSSQGIVLVVNDDPKTRHLMGMRLEAPGSSDALPLGGGIRGSVSVKVMPWKPAQGKHPAQAMVVVNEAVKGGGISVKLPEWARPAANLSAAAVQG